MDVGVVARLSKETLELAQLPQGIAETGQRAAPVELESFRAPAQGVQILLDQREVAHSTTNRIGNDIHIVDPVEQPRIERTTCGS